jgi:sugar lactone lactonase YvrE
LDVMVITTASDELSPEQIAQYPNSGSIFTLVPGVSGLPQSLWGGFTK